MEQKVLFNERLTALIEYAAAHQNRLRMEEIQSHFDDLISDESQYAFIYDYLTENKISIDGYDHTESSLFSEAPSDFEADNLSVKDSSKSEQPFNPTAKESEEELSFIRMYMKELEAIPPADGRELELLLQELSAGNSGVSDRLVELHLNTVATLAAAKRGRGVTFGDLIQEGNMGLILAVSQYQKQHGDFLQYITDAVNEALEQAINIQINADRIGTHLADKLNQLDDATKKLSEQYGRVPEIPELAEEMGLSKDEVSQLLKMSLDTLSVNEDTHITDKPDANENHAASNQEPLTWRVPKKK